MRPDEFSRAILGLALRYPMSVTSWGRTPARNRAVGGVVDSRHLAWLAVDVILDNPTDRESFLRSARRLGLTVLDEHDHLHVQA